MLSHKMVAVRLLLLKKKLKDTLSFSHALKELTAEEYRHPREKNGPETIPDIENLINDITS